ncbi:heme utilization cystosolic carrier protein HutX [Oceanimonas doudoroffii]|uniref:HuvX protein n=1 Tax=Oceanimonas doudoroffii TaxID=84158 RepID=A0A233RIW9_9GAMM|nr:heme utilization cystosolic carrier protein HutX [Oceanimonas doudoroffii]OXY83334.1 HuvX protein [Oceanimonas doudoroffii]
MSELNTQVQALLAIETGLRPVEMARRLNTSEWQVMQCLPTDMVCPLAGEHAQTVLEQVAEWGPVTTIIEAAGSIFEVKAPLPKGRIGHGYYNLFGAPGELHGHLKLDAIRHIALQSKPHRGKEAHAMVFYDDAGHCIFKIYLGRDEKGKLFPAQVAAFHALKELQHG